MGKYVNPLDPPYVAPVVEAPVEANPVADAPAPTSPIPSDEDISTLAELVGNLSADDMDRLKRRLSSNPDLARMLSPASDTNLKKLPDGSIECRITLSPDLISMIEPWAEAAGNTLSQQVQEVAEQAIASYLNMDWAAMATPPAPPPVAGK